MYLKISQIEELYRNFYELATSSSTIEDQWQITEGSILGLNAIISAFSLSSFNNLSNVRVNTTYWKEENSPLYLGHTSYATLPQFISRGSDLRILLFKLLAHNQLSVREAVAETFSSYLCRCNLEESNSTFLEIIPKLQISEKSHYSVGSTHAYEAEGLLSLCLNLIDRMSPSFLQKHLSKFLSVFDAYLAHPASTVRQAVSSVFLRLILKSPPHMCPCDVIVNVNAIFLRLVLQSLASKWNILSSSFGFYEAFLKSTLTKKPSMFQPELEAVVHSSLPPPLILPVHMHNKDDTIPIKCDDYPWEWKEGRLLSYELILEKLLSIHDQVLSNNGTYLSPIGRHNSSKNNRRRLSGNRSPPSEIYFPSTPNSDLLGRRLSAFTIDSESPAPTSPSSEMSMHRRASTSIMSIANIAESNLTTSFSCIKHCSVENPYIDILSTDNDIDFNGCNTIFSVVSPNIDNLDCYTDQATCVRCNLTNYYNELSISPFSDLLFQILLQTIECSLDARWELRRMADQVLPLLIQVLCWFDIDRLEYIWLNFFDKNEFLNCVACLSLKYALRTVLELQQLTSETNLGAAKKAQIQGIIRKIAKCVPTLLPRLFSLFNTSPSDKLVTLCVEILIMIQSEFPLKISFSIKNTIFEIVLRHLIFIQDQVKIPIFTFSSSFNFSVLSTGTPPPCTSTLSSTLDSGLGSPSVEKFVERKSIVPSTTKTFLSRKAERVQFWLISCVHKLIPMFVSAFELEHCSQFMDLFLKYFRDYDDRDIRSSLLKSIDLMMKKIFIQLEQYRPEVPVILEECNNLNEVHGVTDNSQFHNSLGACENFVGVVCELFDKGLENQLQLDILQIYQQICTNHGIIQSEVFCFRLFSLILLSLARRITKDAPGSSPAYFSSSLTSMSKPHMRSRSIISMNGKPILHTPLLSPSTSYLSFPPALDNFLLTPNNSISSVNTPELKLDNATLALPPNTPSFISPMNCNSFFANSNSKRGESFLTAPQPNGHTPIEKNENDPDTDWDSWDDFDSGVNDVGLEQVTKDFGAILKEILLYYKSLQRKEQRRLSRVEIELPDELNVNQSDFILSQLDQLPLHERDVILWIYMKSGVGIFN